MFGNPSKKLRQWQEEARQRREADAADRVLRLSPEVVVHWTKLIQKAATFIQPGERPCDYGPWNVALSKARGQTVPEDIAQDRYAHYQHHGQFRGFMEDMAVPAWPEPRRDMVEFALTFLEADVMLFRSGYAKRHYINQLKRAQLSAKDIARIDAMLRRAVTQGTGLEEYRAWCKMAAHLVANGHLGDLPIWLRQGAEGALLTLQMADGPLIHKILRNGRSEADMKLLAKGPWFKPSTSGLAWPDFNTIVPAGPLTQTQEQQIKRNAWRMLDQIIRRLPDLERDLAVNP